MLILETRKQISGRSFTHLCRPLFAFVGACENIQRKCDPSGAGGVFLRTLINVDATQIYIDARCSPVDKKDETELENVLN